MHIPFSWLKVGLAAHLALLAACGGPDADADADSDGDGYPDVKEVVNFNPTANNYLFNPAIADLPRVSVQLTSTPSIKVHYTRTTGEAVSKGTDLTQTDGTASTRSSSGAYSVAVESRQTYGIAATVGGEVHAGLTDVGASVSTSLTVNAEWSSASTEEVTSTYGKEQARQKSTAMSEIQNFESSETISESSGSVSIMASIVNSGAIACTVPDVVLSAYTVDPASASIQTPVANLKADGGFASNTLKPGESLQNIVFKAEVSAALAKELLANPGGLIVYSPGIELLDASGKAFAHSMTEVSARTARVVIDYGASPPPGFDKAVEDFHVAVDSDGVPVGDVLRDLLRIEYEVGTRPWQGVKGSVDKETKRGLVRVRSMDTDAAEFAYWTTLHCYKAESGASTRFTEHSVVWPESSELDFESISLRPGDVLHLARIVDRDRDGLGERAEIRHGTDPGNADTDGDGLGDRTEAAGWIATTKVAGESVERRVRSSPLLVDSDGDGVSDKEEYDLRDFGSDPSDDQGLMAHFPLDRPTSGHALQISDVVGRRVARYLVRSGSTSGSRTEDQFAVKYVPGKIGEAARLKWDQPRWTRDRIVSPHVPFGRNGAPFTISFWVKLDSAAGSFQLVGQDNWFSIDAVDDGLMMGVRGKGPRCAVQPGFGALPTGTWVFVAGVYTGEEMRLLVSHDGESFPDFDKTLPNTTLLSERLANPGTGDFTIGESRDTPLRHPGTFDDVRIFARGLSEADLLRVAALAAR